MSLLGKILALLNVLGALGLVAVAAMDYGKRQSWAYTYFQHELVLNGLPVSEKEIDAENVPIVNRYGEDTLRDLFNPVGGNPVPTQLAEVQRLKSDLDGKLSACGEDKSKRSHLLARILLSMSESEVERERILACLTHLATPESLAGFKNRLMTAWRIAIDPNESKLDRPRSLAQVFRVEFNTTQGGPAESFVTDLLRDVPEDRARASALPFDKLFEDALDRQLQKFQSRYDALFGLALASPPENAGPKPEAAGQKAAIARLLFGLSPFLAEEVILTDSSKEAEKQQYLQAQAQGNDPRQVVIDSSTFRQILQRGQTVVGLRASVPPLADRAAVLRQLSEAVAASAVMERQQFVNDHGFLIDQIRDQVALVQYQRNLITENKEKLTLTSEVVKQRMAEIAKVEEELARSRETTEKESQQLRRLSETVLQLRIKIRDAILANEKGETRVRELEKQVRNLEK